MRTTKSNESHFVAADPDGFRLWNHDTGPTLLEPPPDFGEDGQFFITCRDDQRHVLKPANLQQLFDKTRLSTGRYEKTAVREVEGRSMGADVHGNNVSAAGRASAD